MSSQRKENSKLAFLKLAKKGKYELAEGITKGSEIQ